MRKVLISILGVLLIILIYFIVLKDINIFNWENKNINDIKELNKEMNKQIDIAKQLNNQQYPDNIEILEKSIKELKNSKEKYESKLKYISNDTQLGVVKVKEYKIERLWIALELYAKEENVELKLDILETKNEDVYDLNVTVVGSYIGITDFIYDIEKDDTLGFRILDFKLTPNTTVEKTEQNNSNKTEENKEEDKTNEVEKEENTENTDNENIENDNENEDIQAMESNTQATAKVDTQNLKATFKIENVGIEFN